MRIIGLDPGPEKSAYAVMGFGGEIQAGKMDNGSILAKIVWRHHFPDDVLVIEQVASFGMPVGAEVFETVFWSGRFAQAWPVKHERIKRHEVKMHLCHSMKANDGTIRQAIIDRYGGKEKAIGRKKNPGPLYGISGDCWSALAVALVYADRQKA